MSGIGGYVRRQDRRHMPSAPGDDLRRCPRCKARLDFITPWNQPHICKELTVGTALSPLTVEKIAHVADRDERITLWGRCPDCGGARDTRTPPPGPAGITLAIAEVYCPRCDDADGTPALA